MKLGISKGRGFHDSLRILEAAGISAPAEFQSGRLPIFQSREQDFVCVQTRASDLPWLLEQGFLDTVIASPIIMEEHGNPDLIELAALDMQLCRLSLIVQRGRADAPLRRVCTRFPNLTASRACSLEPGTEIIRLSGSHEISLALGFADAIVDVVETGWTLAAMQLEELEVLYPRVTHGIWARLGDEASKDWLRTFLPEVLPIEQDAADARVGIRRAR
jgi:ATP phosphoribosyltransferase